MRKIAEPCSEFRFSVVARSLPVMMSVNVEGGRRRHIHFDHLWLAVDWPIASCYSLGFFYVLISFHFRGLWSIRYEWRVIDATGAQYELQYITQTDRLDYWTLSHVCIARSLCQCSDWANHDFVNYTDILLEISSQKWAKWLSLFRFRI